MWPNSHHHLGLSIQEPRITWQVIEHYSLHTLHARVFKLYEIANGSRSRVAGTGTIHLSNTLTLHLVLFVPDLDCNLISVSRLNNDLHCETKFLAKSCVFQDLSSGKMIGSADLCAGLYLLKSASASVCSQDNKTGVSPQCWSINHLESVSQYNKDSAILLWHYRLGHPNFMYLKRLFPSLLINKDPKFFQCDICQLSKTHSEHILTTSI